MAATLVAIVIEKSRAAIVSHGFGVLTEIDVPRLRAKLKCQLELPRPCLTELWHEASAVHVGGGKPIVRGVLMRIFQLNAYRSDAGRSVLTSTSVEELFRVSESEAEYTTGWVRITLGLALFASGFLVSSGTAALTEEHDLIQFRVAALITVGAFLALGMTSFLLVISRWFRPWMAFVLVTGDATILGVSLYFGLDGISLVPVHKRLFFCGFERLFAGCHRFLGRVMAQGRAGYGPKSDLAAMGSWGIGRRSPGLL